MLTNREIFLQYVIEKRHCPKYKVYSFLSVSPVPNISGTSPELSEYEIKEKAKYFRSSSNFDICVIDFHDISPQS